jgi:hypothetical protein
MDRAADRSKKIDARRRVRNNNDNIVSYCTDDKKSPYLTRVSIHNGKERDFIRCLMTFMVRVVCKSENASWDDRRDPSFFPQGSQLPSVCPQIGTRSSDLGTVTAMAREPKLGGRNQMMMDVDTIRKRHAPS